VGLFGGGSGGGINGLKVAMTVLLLAKGFPYGGLVVLGGRGRSA